MNNKQDELFTIGYSECRNRIGSYSMSCLNCVYYYQSVGDKTEVCQNNNVLEYDLIVHEHNVFCSHWKLSDSKEDHLFKKTGRNRLD